MSMDATNDEVDLQRADGTWWYQYPDGTWVWWSKDESRWVRLEAPRVVRTPRWVWLLIALAVIVSIAGGIVVVQQFPDYLEEDLERMEQQQESETQV